MNRKFKSLLIKSFGGILAASSILMTPLTCLAKTNPEKINSLLQELYAENPGLRGNEEEIKREIYERVRIAREHNYCGKNRSDHSLINDASDCKDVFSKIYDSNFWGSDESKSGPGSQIGSTEKIRKSLPKLFKKYGIKSVLDAPCGDYNWMKSVDKTGIKYIGGDIVDKIIRTNNKNYKDENTSFRVMDITSNKIPQVDLIICRDCLQHLSHKNVKKALKNFKDSGSKYLLVTNYPWTLDNYDIKNGDFNPLNLLEKPFELPAPIEKIKELNRDGNCPDKYLYLYKLEDIDTDKMVAPKKAPDSIPIAMALDENYIYPTIVAISSVMESSTYDSKYDFYIMHPSNFSDEAKNTLKSMEKTYANCKITLIDMKDKFKSAYTDSRITTPAYYRLMLSDVLPNLDKIIWMDGDALTFHDLTEMFNVDMEGYCYKGFLDFPWNNEHLENSFGIEDDHYICDGIMVVNLKELRKENAVKKFEEFIAKNNDKLEQHDQTVINAVFTDKIGVLPAKFGIWDWFENREIDWPETLTSPEKYTQKEMDEAKADPTLLHCTFKPWYFWSPQNAIASWWRIAEGTKYFDKIKQKYTIPDGIYQIVSALNPRKVWDIDHASTENGAKLQLWSKNDTDAQKFKVTYDKDGYYTIEAVCSGKMIDVPCASREECTQLWQYENNNSDAQKWYIIRNKDGSHHIVSKCNGMHVDVRRAEVANGTKIQCFSSNGTNAQNFRFVKTN